MTHSLIKYYIEIDQIICYMKKKGMWGKEFAKDEAMNAITKRFKNKEITESEKDKLFKYILHSNRPWYNRFFNFMKRPIIR